MNDFMDVKLAFSNYIRNIADVIYRYIDNSALKKVLLFPLFLIILLLEIAIFPIALVGALARFFIKFVYWASEDRSYMLYILLGIFIELFLLYYVVFGLLMLFYLLFDLLSNGLGKANNEYNADDFVARYDYRNSDEEKENNDIKKEETEDGIYVINTDDFK